jgi:hypothetical protein
MPSLLDTVLLWSRFAAAAATALVVGLGVLLL